MDERQCQHYRYWERNRVSSTSHGKCKPSAIDVIRPTRAQHRMWLFAQEYVVDSHGTNAAIRAGYAERSAHVMASQLLRNPNVSIWIAEAQELKARSRNITVERVLEEFRRIAFAQTTDMVTLKDGFVVIKDTASLTTEQKSAISQIRQKKDGELEVRFYDKQKALDSLAKYLGIFSDKNTGQNPGVQPQINIVFGEAPAAAIVEGEVRELPEGGDNG